jgi:diguanylate cyclase (GGDEF)-like protein
MGAKGELIGMLHIKRQNRACPLTGRSFERSIESTAQTAGSIAEHVALTITNIRLRDELRSQSIRDPLTELYNRRYMEETFERECRRAQRKGHSLAVIILDVDHFKALNDSHGHEAGDVVLAQLGKTLRDNVRAGDVSCRYGGEEFVVIMPEVDLKNALERAESLRARAEHLATGYQGNTLRITISLGVAMYPDHGETPEALISAADAALYAAKRAGRNRVMCAETPQAADTMKAKAEQK